MTQFLSFSSNGVPADPRPHWRGESAGVLRAAHARSHAHRRAARAIHRLKGGLAELAAEANVSTSSNFKYFTTQNWLPNS